MIQRLYIFSIAITILSFDIATGELGQCLESEVVLPVTAPVVHGEGPHWDQRQQTLYFVDITSQTVNRYNPVNGTVASVYIKGGPVSPVVPTRKPGWFVVGRGLDLVHFYWDGASKRTQRSQVLASVDADKKGNRFNDGKADSSGRLWIGTMGPEDPVLKPNQGALYSFDPLHNFAPRKHISSVSVSNGLGWNKNDTLMYYIDSPTRSIDVYDFDLIKGTIKNRRPVFKFEKYGIIGVPDGMAVDSEDRLWVAVYGGSAVLHVDPTTGSLLHTIRFPVSQVTSCAFGDPGLTTLYVTTSRKGLSEEELAREPLAGSVFSVTGLRDIKGQRKTNSAMFNHYQMRGIRGGRRPSDS